MSANSNLISIRHSIVVRAFLLICLFSSFSNGQSEQKQFSGDAAVNKLQNNGQYESLKAAFSKARETNRPGADERTENLVAQTDRLTRTGAPSEDAFGKTVAISGDLAVVGAPNADGGKGRAYVFGFDGTNWTLTATLSAPGGAVGDMFGGSVALFGNVAAVAAPGNDMTASNAGAVYVFLRSPDTLMWDLAATLTSTDGADSDAFGSALAFQFDYLAIGAPGATVSGNPGQGAVYLFARTSILLGDYTQNAKLTASDGAAGDRFGTSVSFTAEPSVIIGAPKDDVSGNPDQGSVYRFRFVGSVGWLQLDKFTASDGQAGDEFGISLNEATSAVTIIIGAWRDDIGGRVDQGSVYVFATIDSSPWGQRAKLIASDGAAGDRFGSTVAYNGVESASGGTVIIGSPRSDSGGTDQGAAYFYRRTNGFWNENEKVTGSDSGTNDEFGSGVSISNTAAIVGSPGEIVGGTLRQGAAYIFQVTSGGYWSQQQNLGAGGEFDRFGTSLALDGTTAIIGAPGDDVGPNADQGSAFIFVLSGSTWTFQAQIFAADGAALDQFGSSVAVSGNTVIVGSPEAKIGSNLQQGAAYVFVRSGSVWTQQRKLTASNGRTSDFFGSSVSIDGNSALVGAYLADLGSNTDRGAAYVYQRVGTTWTAEADLFAAGGAFSDYFGASVVIRGDTVVIGAPYTDVSGVTDQGVAYVFVRSGGIWSEQATLIGSVANGGASFGSSVALNGDTVVVGAPFEDIATGNTGGAAYVFGRLGTIWQEDARLTAADGANLDQFGQSVAVSGNTAVIGSPYSDPNGNPDQGAAYLFSRSGTGWSLSQKLIDSTGAAGDQYGTSVAVSMNRILVGSPFSDATVSTPLRDNEKVPFVPTATDQGTVAAFEFEPLAPTAASVSVAGRVRTSDGQGIQNATVYLIRSDGTTRSTRTGSFGYYRFDEVEAGQAVVIGVYSKRFQFESRVLSIDKSLANVDFFPVGIDEFK